MFEVLFEAYNFKLNYSEFLFDSYQTKDLFFFLANFAGVIISFLLFFAFILFSLNSSWKYKIICFTLFLFSALIEFGYHKALNRFFATSDFNTANGTNFEQKINSMLMYLNPEALIPAFVFLLLIIFVESKQKKSNIKNFALLFLCFILFYSLLSQFGNLFYDKKFPAPAMNVFCQTGVDYLIQSHLSHSDETWDLYNTKPRYPVKNPNLSETYKPDNNIIMILDESVSGIHLSLNGYDRPTTPFLDDLEEKNILHNWGIASSSATASLNSYRAIITGFTSEDMKGNNGTQIHYAQTIFQYAKAMKYTTFYFDGQMTDYWGGTSDDKNYLDNVIGYQQIVDTAKVPDYEIDNYIAREINKIIKSSTGNFIFVFKRGSHIPYHKNFPASQTVWSPSYTTIDFLGVPSEDKISEVTNAYDNSIRYNVNSFFKNLIDDYENIPNKSVVLYTGDHGQTLFEGGRASHGGSSKIEASVPLFMIGNLDKVPDTNFATSHNNIYPTLLDLMKYPKKLRHKHNVLSLLEAKSYDSKKRFYNPVLAEEFPFD